MVDVVQYKGAYDVSRMRGNGPITLDRWVLDPAAAKVTRRRLDDRLQEFPRVDERVVSRPHRYGYSAVIGEVSRALIPLSGDFADQAFANELLKHDLAHGTLEAHEFGPDASAGEAVFAPASPSAPEDGEAVFAPASPSAPEDGEAVFAPASPSAPKDDAYVMAFVHNPDRGAADLVILAAQDFHSQPVAQIHLPARIPLGFHGRWIPDH